MVEAAAGDSDKEDLNSRDSDEDDLAEAEEEKTWSGEGGEVVEPHVGMEFDSEDDARRFYNDYARRVGFVVRVMQRRRSEIDGRTLARRLGCNKQGFSPNTKGMIGPEKKPRPSAREGCKATILFKLEKSGKWVVTRFVKEHNHPLVVTAQEDTNVVRPTPSSSHIYQLFQQKLPVLIICSRMQLDKDKRIQELARELQRQEELCAAYRERLINLLSTVESQADQMSSKVLAVVESVKKAEAEALTEALTIPLDK
ncbi:protein FAR1-RELATED SEQUENCE 5-like isoform X1 [Salvia miltiorrhiza]|uniref:protein FAR1-RELATED SEQUENCE 5-like isoform X1 n=1 Tax=Salvia miltiorrhiza TaxID=226208 RepID=UPI0025AC1975|nr:protein FAR1-RELATED SEQUENCE 5-like isoform X1 [Salvia miltiorrhiza]